MLETKTLRENIYKLMDFNEDQIFGFVKEEFKAKYLESYVLIDDNPAYINHIEDILICDINVFNLHDNHTITNIILKPGLYLSSTKETLFYLFKYPTRQYCKGIRFGVTHGMLRLSGLEEPSLNISYVGNTIIYKKNVFIYNKHIGIIDQNVIKLKPDYLHLKEECAELWPQYVII